MLWTIAGAFASGPYVVPELSLRLLRQGARVPDRVDCEIFSCNQKPVFPLTYGGSVLLDQHVYVRVNRTTFLNRRQNTHPWILDVRMGVWAAFDGAEPEAVYVPVDQIFAFVGLRAVHDTGDGDELLKGQAIELGFLTYYTADTLPEGVAAYVEFSYFRYVHAEWQRQSTRHHGGFQFRVGANVGPAGFGMNITADPGFGFSAMLEFTARAGLALRP